MNLTEQLKAALPALKDSDFGLMGSILLQNDSDGLGDYIARWDYSEPLPEGFALGK